MSEKEKFEQMNREAKATVCGLGLVILFWIVAGFGLSKFDITIWHTPIWVLGGCVGTGVFAVIITVFLTKKVFKNFNLEEKEDE